MSTTEDSSGLQEIHAHLRELEAENHRLQTAHASSALRGARQFSWRAFFSALLIIMATVLVPISILAGWAKAELVDETTFVQTLAPLAKDPAVRAEIVKHTSAAMNSELSVDTLVDAAFDGLDSLDMPDEAKSALELLRGPAINGAHGLIDAAITEVVHSEAFADTWKAVLTASHRALIVAASGSTAGGEITIESDGDIVLHLGPVVTEVKESLVKQGFGLASQIPDINTSIKLAHSDTAAYVGPIYHSAVTLGWVLPSLSFLLFAAGIMLATKRRTGVTGTGVGLVLGSVATLLFLSGAGVYLVTQAVSLGISPSAVEAVYGHLAARMIDTSVTLVMIGVLLILLAWLTGDSSPARALRSTAQGGNAALASALRTHGFDGGAVGQWLSVQRVFTRSLLVALVVLTLLLLPVSASSVIWTAAIAIAIWWVLAVCEAVAADTSPTPAKNTHDHPTRNEDSLAENTASETE